VRFRAPLPWQKVRIPRIAVVLTSAMQQRFLSVTVVYFTNGNGFNGISINDGVE
jgi:hypothetical protein